MVSRAQLNDVAANAQIVVVGGGPVGALTAYLTGQNVVMLEKRDKYTRDHTVRLEKSSFATVSPTDEKLNLLIKEWFGDKSQVSLPIQQIERDLVKILPKNVQILNGVEFVSLENTKPEEKTLHVKGIAELSKIFKKAQIIVGADGANSLIREEICGVKKGEETLQHTVLVKLLTEKKPREQSFLSQTLTMAKCGRVFHQHIGKVNEKGLYPVSVQMVIDEAEYRTIQKGTFQNPLTLTQVADSKLKKSISLWLSDRFKKYQDLKIIPIPLKTFIAPKIVSKKMGEPLVVLSGDSSGYMPHQLAINTGIQQALQLGTTLRSHFQNESPRLRSIKTIPESFKEYESNARLLLEDSIRRAEFKTAKIQLGDSSIISSGKLMGKSGFDVAGRSQTSWDVASSIGQFATAVFKGFRSLLPF